MWLKGDGRRRETGEMAGEIVGDRPGAALWAMEDCWDFIPSAINIYAEEQNVVAILINHTFCSNMVFFSACVILHFHFDQNLKYSMS